MLEFLLMALVIAGGLLLVIWLMAKIDFCFTMGVQGEAREVQKNGKFDHFLVWKIGEHVNDPRRPWHVTSYTKKTVEGGVTTYETVTAKDWDIIPNEPGQTYPLYNNRPLNALADRLNIYWIGPSFPPWNYKIASWKESWVEPYQKKVEGSEDVEIAPRPRINERTNRILVMNFPYWVDFRMLEIQGNLRVRMQALATLAVTNPYTRRYGIDDWLTRVMGELEGVAKQVAAIRDFDGMREERKVGDVTFKELFMGLDQELRDQTGNTIRDFTFLRVGPDGRTQDEIDNVVQLLEKTKRAEIEGQARIAEATANATVVTTEATAKAEAVRTVGRSEAEVITAKGTATAGAAEALLVAETASPDRVLVTQAKAAAALGQNASTFAPGNEVLGFFTSLFGGRGNTNNNQTPPQQGGGAP